MVLRTSSLPHSPVKSRGTSPFRNGTSSNGYRYSPSPNSKRTPPRSSSMQDGFRGISPIRRLNERNLNRSSQRSVILRSRGSE